MLEIIICFSAMCLWLMIGIVWAWLDCEKSKKELGMNQSKTYTLAMDAWWWICLIGEMVVVFFIAVAGAIINLIIISIKGCLKAVTPVIPEPQAYDQTNQSEKDLV